MIHFAGLQKLTLLDVPGSTAATLFTAACNLRCPFCHNASLVPPDAPAPLSGEAVLDFLRRRQGLLDAVCITGGEPLLQPLAPFLEKVHALGYRIKLDTNGTLPGTLMELVRAGLVDQVAMDIKSGPSGYARACGLPRMDLGEIRKSVDFLLSGTLPFEFRTTVVRGLHTPEDLLELAEWIAGNEPYFLQAFVRSEDIPDATLEAFPAPEMEAMRQQILPFLPMAQLRGISL